MKSKSSMSAMQKGAMAKRMKVAAPAPMMDNDADDSPGGNPSMPGYKRGGMVVKRGRKK